MKELLLIESLSTNPYVNLALEEEIFNSLKSNEKALFLYQNTDSVIIGRHQELLYETNLNFLENNNIYIARRFSGGGAVYHDLGNLNFSFISSSKEFSKDLNSEIILKTLEEFDINAYKNDRYDLLINDKKFCGSAYYYKNNKKLHHGTMLIYSNINKLYLSLQASEETNLRKNTVESNRSIVTNISTINNNISIDKIKNKLFNIYSNYNSDSKIKYLTLDNEAFRNYDFYQNAITRLKSISWIYERNTS